MSNIRTLEGDFSPTNASYVLVVARFNSFIVDSLQAGAIDALVRHGVAEKNITVVKVPGAFELPLVAQKLAASKKFDAIIALGTDPWQHAAFRLRGRRMCQGSRSGWHAAGYAGGVRRIDS